MSRYVPKKLSRRREPKAPTASKLAKMEARSVMQEKRAVQREKKSAEEAARELLLATVALRPVQESEARLCRHYCWHEAREWGPICNGPLALVRIEGIVAFRCDNHGFVPYSSTKVFER